MDTLTSGEGRLIAAAAVGETCNLHDLPVAERGIRNAVLRDLCLQRHGWSVDPVGIVVTGAHFPETLALCDLDLAFGLSCLGCFFAGDLDIRGSRLRHLNLSGCEVAGALRMSGATVAGDLCLDRGRDGGADAPPFRVHGAADFEACRVGGLFNAEGARFLDDGERCLYARNIEVGRGVFLRDGFEAAGRVDFAVSRIGRQFVCDGGRFRYPDGDALVVFNTEIGQDVFLSEGFEAVGAVNFHSAKVGGQFSCEGGRFAATGDRCLWLERIAITGDAVFRDAPLTQTDRVPRPFLAEGTLHLRGAYLRGDLCCQSGTFHGFTLENGVVEGALIWEPGLVLGIIDLNHARVGVLDDRYAIPLKPIRRNFLVRWRDARLMDWFGYAAQDMRTDRYQLAGLTYGSLRQDLGKRGLELAQWLIRADAGHYHPQPYEQMVRVLKAQGYEETARDVAIAKQVARRRELLYNLLRNSPSDFSMSWLRWILKVVFAFARQVSEYFLLDFPFRYGYRPWYAVFHSILWIAAGTLLFGRAYQAGAMVPASDDLLPIVVQQHQACACRVVLNAMTPEEKAKAPEIVDYCSDPQRIGSQQAFPALEKRWRDLPKKSGARECDLCRQVPAGYAAFNPLLYTLDVFLPIVSLNQEIFWLPDRDAPGGSYYWTLQSALIFVGWYLSTLFVSAFTGLIKTE